jgi:hypothetical protein
MSMKPAPVLKAVEVVQGLGDHQDVVAEDVVAADVVAADVVAADVVVEGGSFSKRHPDIKET